MGKQYRKYSLNEELLNEKSEEQSYFLGFFTADGHLGDTYIRISSAEEEVFENLKQCLNSEHTIHNRDETDYIAFHSKTLANRLKDMGFEKNKSYNLIYPSNVINRHFIRGYFDGDGHVLKDNGYLRTGFTSVDKNFLEKIQNVLDKEDIRSNLYSRDNSYRLTLSSRPSKKLYDYMYPANIFLSRKKQELENNMTNLDKKTWEPDEIEYLKKNYQDLKDTDIADHLDRSHDSVESKRLSLGLNKYNNSAERERDEKGRFK